MFPGFPRTTAFATFSLLLRVYRTHHLKSVAVRLISVFTMTEKGEKKAFERLPSHVLPKNYALILTPNLKDFTFAGEEVVEIQVRMSESCTVLYTCTTISLVRGNY